MAKGKYRSSARREQILEAAADLFQNGYRSTSLDDVAAKLGITRPALYYYFRSKEELLTEIYERGVELLINRVTETFSQNLAPDVLLHKMMDIHVRTMLQERPIVRVYFQEKDSLGPAASRSVKDKEVAFTKMMAQTIERGQALGVFRSGNAEMIVNAILGMLIWVHAWYRPQRHDGSAISREFWSLLSAGLINDGSHMAADLHLQQVESGSSPLSTAQLSREGQGKAKPGQSGKKKSARTTVRT